jgi:hypothetical protein
MVLFLVGLLGLLAYHLKLQDRARRDVIDLARRLADRGQAVPPEMLDRLLAGPEKMEAPKWLAPAFFLLLAVGFILAGIDQEGRNNLDERLLLFGVAFLFLAISGIAYVSTRSRE